jgi:hypothetical protein
MGSLASNHNITTVDDEDHAHFLGQILVALKEGNRSNHPPRCCSIMAAFHLFYCSAFHRYS